MRIASARRCLLAAPFPDEEEMNAPYSAPVGAEVAGPSLRPYARGENLADQVGVRPASGGTSPLRLPIAELSGLHGM